MIIKTKVRDVEVVIPDGFSVIEAGEIQKGDQFLVGGRRNAWMGTTHIWCEYPATECGSSISPLALIIRKTTTTNND
jgi:hypothetical protein